MADTPADPPAVAKPDVKPKIDAKAEGAEPINVKVRDAEGNVLQFKVKPTTPFKKIFAAYCTRQKVSADAFRFHFDGTRVNDDDTPAKLDMEDLDVIDASNNQVGGAC